MTKDVLVSVKGTQLIGEENDSIEIITSGMWYEKNGKQYLLFDESIGDGEELTHNTVKIWPDKIEVTKKGMVDSHMVFECGKRHTANYMTPVGLIVLGLTTSAMEVRQEEKTLHIAITYSLEMNGEYVSGCCLELTARSRGEGALRLT